ncbi:hypothetical protein [Brachymonas denitrificans]|uniref:hypothetical protein n=1 Tax=Brachymonas denitrificans TaxID=28220 RepID=UPI002AFDDD85|nr:hypothetical protein [Brachymonas denitrificans]
MRFAPRRHLTAAEIALVQPLFRDGLDYAQIRIQSGGWLGLPHMTRAALAHGNTLVFPPRLVRHDFAEANDATKVWFVHELVHAWQWQRGFRLWRHGVRLALRGGYGRLQRAYRYQHLLPHTERFCDLNMEQQADLIAHYFDAAFLQGDGSVHDRTKHVEQLPHYRALLADFLVNPCNLALVPARGAHRAPLG